MDSFNIYFIFIFSQEVITSLWPLSILPLNILDPVPSDIEIARSQVPKHIAQLAKEIGLTEDEVISVTMETI